MAMSAEDQAVLESIFQKAVLTALTVWARAPEVQAIHGGEVRKGVLDGSLDLIRSAEYKATETQIVKDGTA